MNQSIKELLGVGERLIMDPVHGGISLFHHEIQVIDHPLFQRLRSICQNDILSLVFPGATHSRFLHSIGTLHVGHRIYRALIENCLRNNQSTASNTSDKDRIKDHLTDINYFNKLVRLACLLHDSGHSCFSHQFSKVTSIDKILRQPGLFDQLWSGIDTADIYHDKPEKLKHEHYSVRCAYEILDRRICQLANIEASDVMALMETTSAVLSRQFTRHANSIWSLLTGSPKPHHQAAGHIRNLLRLIVSGEIDADRADYMLRDGFHSSVTLGGFNLDHLLKNLHVGWDSELNWMGMAITHKGLGALEDFVYSRHQMYRKVYGHKTSIGFDWLLRKAIDEVLKTKEAKQFIETCLNDIKIFKHLTDYYFWEQFRTIARRQPRSCSALIVDRIRLKPLHSMENVEIGQLKEKKEKVAAFNGIEPEGLVTCELKARFSGIKRGFNAIKVINFRPNSNHKDIYYSLISEESQFFEKFCDGNIIHFYLAPDIDPI